jgi:hypothetical protein
VSACAAGTTAAGPGRSWRTRAASAGCASSRAATGRALLHAHPALRR